MKLSQPFSFKLKKKEVDCLFPRGVQHLHTIYPQDTGTGRSIHSRSGSQWRAPNPLSVSVLMAVAVGSKREMGVPFTFSYLQMAVDSPYQNTDIFFLEMGVLKCKWLRVDKRTPYPTPPPQYAAVAYLMDQQYLVLHSMLYQSSLSNFV